MEIGTKVKIVQDIDVSPTAYIHAGETGTVSQIEKDFWMVKLDKHHPELDEWDNQIEIWDWSDDQHPEWKPEAHLEAI